MLEQEKIKQQFIEIGSKGLDELTTNEQDYLLKMWEEKNDNKGY